jgi:NRPS condensation-like uncharacterized protein
MRSTPASPKDYFHQYGRGTGAGSSSDQQIRTLIRYGGLLDLARLRQAVRAVVQGDPMLRARLVEGAMPSAERPGAPLEGRWEVIEGEGFVPEVELAEVGEAEREPAISAFLADTTVRDEGPYVFLRVVRAGGRDALCLRVDHRLCDGAGAKIIAYRISEAYRRLAAGEPLPPPRTELLPRTVSGLTGRTIPPPPPPTPRDDRHSYALPRRGFANEQPAHAVRVVEAAVIAAVRKEGKPLGATLNDVLLTALERALAPHHVGPLDAPLVLLTAAEYRPRLPPGTPEVVCNLFQALFPGLHHVPGRSFRDGLVEAAQAMGRLRAAFTLEDALQAEAGFTAGHIRFARQPPAPAGEAARQGTFVLLSNVGLLDPARLELGDPPVLDAQMLGTVALLREILVCASTFRGTLTLSIGFCQSDLDASVPQGILDRMAAELRSFATA